MRKGREARPAGFGGPMYTDRSANYPDGGVTSKRESVRCHCEDCDETWDVEGVSELGAFTPDETSDWRCPECNRMVDDDNEVPSRKDDDDE